MKDHAGNGLVAPETRIARDLAGLICPDRQWVISRTHPLGQHIWNDVFLGNCMCGLGNDFGLRRAHRQDAVENRLWHPQPELQQVLRSALQPRRLGSDADFPDFGLDGPTEMVPSFHDLPVENGVEVTGVDPAEGDLLRIHIRRDGCPDSLLARKLAVATGRIDQILLWRDQFATPPGGEEPTFATAAYLCSSFELMAKDRATAP